MKFSVWPNSEPSRVGDPRPGPPRRHRGLARPLVRRPLHAEHRQRGVQPRATCTSAGRCCRAIAAVTERVRLGSLVAPTSVHHPAVLANRAATIDHISNGRLVLGIGAGWQINEHHAYGIELEPPAHAGRPVRGGDPDRAQPVRRTSAPRSRARTTRSPTPRWTRSRCSRRCRSSSARRARACCASPRARRRMEHVGRTRVGRRRRRRSSSRRANASGATRHRCASAHKRWWSSPTMPTSVAKVRAGDDGGAHDRRLDRPDRRARSAGYADLGFDEFIVPDWAFARRSRHASRPARRALRRPHRRPRLSAIARFNPRLRQVFCGLADRKPDANGSWTVFQLSLDVPIGRGDARMETIVDRHAPPRPAGSCCARSSSSDARLTAFTPPIAATSFFFLVSPRPGDAVERARRSSACCAVRRGTCWRTGAPRHGRAAA